MAGEDARLLHELDGIAEEDMTTLDDFQCYVKLSLHGHLYWLLRLSVLKIASLAALSFPCSCHSYTG